jgi:hypothetical protein
VLPNIRRPSFWRLAGIVLVLWVLAARFLPLSEADNVREPYLVMIYRIRNTGTAPVNVSATMSDALLETTTVAPGDTKRVDVAWERSTSNRPTYLQLTARTPLGSSNTSRWRTFTASRAGVSNS